MSPGRAVWPERDAAADVAAAEHVIDRLGAQNHPASSVGRRRVAMVAGASPPLGSALATRPALVRILDTESLPAWTPEDVQREALDTSLEAAHTAGLVRIAARDLSGVVGTDRTAAELSDLADGLIRAALIRTDAPEDLTVIGMGKLGAGELNYVSDVDVMFVGDTAGALHEQAARRVVAALSGMDQRGRPYHVDVALRPEGRNGPLVRTIDSYASYYQDWSATWERQALLKARALAGPAVLRHRFDDLVAGVVWADVLGGDAVDEIQAMKTRVERSGPVRRAGADRELKLAPGGLRDIEFAVQLLQLVHGPEDPTLRPRATLPALRSLASGGYVDEGDANLFSDAYLFLRTLEHRLQLRGLRRTHVLPTDERAISVLARSMGFHGIQGTSAAEQFTAELTRVRAGVRRLHQRLFYRPLLSSLAGYGTEDRVVTLHPAQARRRLQALGFARPGRALTDVHALAAGSDRTARQLRVILPAMLDALGDSPDPDGGLAALRDLVEALRGNPRLDRTIRDNPAAAQQLTALLGASPRLATGLAQHPEMLRLFDEPDAMARPRTADELHTLAAGLLHRTGRPALRRALQRYSQRETLRTAMRDLSGTADPEQMAHELTWVGEGLVRAAADGVRLLTDLTPRPADTAVPRPPEVRMAIIAVGSFGASQLSHGSDLDIVFVHRGPRAPATMLARDVIALLDEITAGTGTFVVDTDLRPQGRAGAVTRTVDSHLRYVTRWAEPAERMAMTQMRPIAGDMALAERLVERLADQVYGRGVTDAEAVSIRRTKVRIETERAGGGARRRRDRDLKLGPGGLSDVEWTVQLLQLQHGWRVPTLRVIGAMAGVSALSDAGLLTPAEAVVLREGWTALTAIRNSLHHLGVRDSTLIPEDPTLLGRLASVSGLGDTQALEAHVRRHRRRVRRVVDDRFFA